LCAPVRLSGRSLCQRISRAHEVVGKPGRVLHKNSCTCCWYARRLGLCGCADTCAAWKRKISMEKGEKSIMKQYQQSRPPANPSKFLGFATGLLIFLLLVILGQILYGF